MSEPSTGLEGQISEQAEEQVGVDLTATSDTPLEKLRALDQDTATTLVGMARAMYPHDGLPDVHYERVVAALDTKAAADPDVKALLTEGVGLLATTTGRWPRDFGGLPEPEQVAALTRLEHTPFFQAIAAEVVVNLYSQPDVWPHFGYEGPAPEGYLDTFDDIDWLDDAPDRRDGAVVNEDTDKQATVQTEQGQTEQGQTEQGAR